MMTEFTLVYLNPEELEISAKEVGSRLKKAKLDPVLVVYDGNGFAIVLWPNTSIKKRILEVFQGWDFTDIVTAKKEDVYLRLVEEMAVEFELYSPNKKNRT